MNTPIIRVVAVVGGVLGLIGPAIAPARATTVTAITFVGTANVNGGLTAPCSPLGWDVAVLPGPLPGAEVSHPEDCPQGTAFNTKLTWQNNAQGTPTPVVLTTPLGSPPLVTGIMEPLPDGTQNITYNIHGSPQKAFAFASSVCAGTGANVLKPKPPVTGPLCSINAAGVVWGWCGLSSGRGAGHFVDLSGNPAVIRFVFNSVGGVLVLSGHAVNAKGQQGLLAGVALALPSTGDCLTTPATSFTLVGTAEAVLT